MHLYAFGSVCRGDIGLDSDVDLLALVSAHDDRLDPSKFSIYSYSKMRLMWSKGSPFAWHLALESRLLFASDGGDFLKSLGIPARYSDYARDCEKFLGVFEAASQSLRESLRTKVFDLSAIFLSVRNISTCFALGVLGRPNFSRNAALSLDGEFVLPVSQLCYRTLERSRILCTRSQGSDISEEELSVAISEFDAIGSWMGKLLTRAKEHDRVQQSGRCTTADT